MALHSIITIHKYLINYYSLIKNPVIAKSRDNHTTISHKDLAVAKFILAASCESHVTSYTETHQHMDYLL